MPAFHPNETPQMYCRECEYPLDGLSKPECPECGCAFDVTDKSTYRTKSPRQQKILLTKAVVVSIVIPLSLLILNWVFLSVVRGSSYGSYLEYEYLIEVLLLMLFGMMVLSSTSLAIVWGIVALGSIRDRHSNYKYRSSDIWPVAVSMGVAWLVAVVSLALISDVFGFGDLSYSWLCLGMMISWGVVLFWQFGSSGIREVAVSTDVALLVPVCNAVILCLFVLLFLMFGFGQSA